MRSPPSIRRGLLPPVSAKSYLSPPPQTGRMFRAPRSSRASSIATFDDGARRGARQRHRGGAPGGAAAYVTGRAHPEAAIPGNGDIAVGARWTPLGSARGAYVTGPSRGSRNAAPWRLPALHPLVGGRRKMG